MHGVVGSGGQLDLIVMRQGGGVGPAVLRPVGGGGGRGRRPGLFPSPPVGRDGANLRRKDPTPRALIPRRQDLSPSRHVDRDAEIRRSKHHTARAFITRGQPGSGDQPAKTMAQYEDRGPRMILLQEPPNHVEISEMILESPETSSLAPAL